MLSPVLTVLRGLVFPPVCEGCGALVPASLPDPVCASCALTFRPITEPACRLCARHWPTGGKCLACQQDKVAYEAVHVAFSYEGTLQTLIHTYKFSRRRALGPFLGRRLCDFAKKRLGQEKFDAVVAVPADPKKAAERGFHPPQDWARLLSKTLAIPDRSSWLAARSRPAQVALSREERRRNVRGRFYFSGNRTEAAGRSVLLVDDVLTTGSTIAECAWVLQSAGIATVTALCLAHGESR